MRNFNLNGCSFKPIELKRHKISIKHRYNHKKKVYCVCIEETPNTFKAYVNIESNLEFPDTRVIPFTEESYNLKGKTKVFTIQKDKNRRSICVLRNTETATHFPGIPTQYTPFKHKYVYSGYIMKINGEYQFEVNEVFDHIDFYKHLVPNIKLRDTDNEEK